jgi:SAM-dependent methyltransferase
MTAKGTLDGHICPSCGAGAMDTFYELRNVPVHSVLLLTTKEEALNCPTGDIVLGFCQACGLISNLAFDPGLHDYSTDYESTQACSPTFNEFARRLALYLIARHDLHDKDIVEIGCGQGEFLNMICEMGGNRGIGFDPAYVPRESENTASDNVAFVQDFYSDRYTDNHGDLICCRMTLEHIQQTAEFVRTVRRSVGERSDSVVFFQVPDVTRILREVAFWDIYYEHCSYFSAGSLARLFQICGFEVMSLWADYGGQYLMIEARPSAAESRVALSRGEDLRDMARDIASFAANHPERVGLWRDRLERMSQAGQRVVVWGAGSKAVAFLTTLGIRDEIEYAVDINPRKHGTHLACTGQEVVEPGFLQTYDPDVVMVMNPIYGREVRRDLDRMGVAARVITVVGP